jgi:hypothetical protein
LAVFTDYVTLTIKQGHHEEKVEEVALAVSNVKALPPAEKFSTLKVWTNVYRLAVGTFCMVHRLTLPNEISNTIFCLCLWAEGSLERFRDRSRRKLCSWIRSSTTCLSALLVVALCMKSGGSFISGRLKLPATAWDLDLMSQAFTFTFTLFYFNNLSQSVALTPN